MRTAAQSAPHKAVASPTPKQQTQVVCIADLTDAENKVVVKVEDGKAKLVIWKDHLKQHSATGSATVLSTDVREFSLPHGKGVRSLRFCDGDCIPLAILKSALQKVGIHPKYVWVEVLA